MLVAAAPPPLLMNLVRMQTQITAAQVYNNTLSGGPDAREEELKHKKASGI
jgi:hypothetical protein